MKRARVDRGPIRIRNGPSRILPDAWAVMGGGSFCRVTGDACPMKTLPL